MKYEVNNKQYDVVITRKNNKNTYVRVKDDMKIYVTTSYLTPDKFIKKLLDDNYEFLCRSIDNKCKQKEKESKFILFGKSYDIILDDSLNKLYIDNNKIYASSMKTLDKWLSKEMRKLYEEHLNVIYGKFEENIPYPKLKIRTMKTRWGVCNRRDNSVTLNSKLVEFTLDKLDYVITHELSHFVHFNHSKEFWLIVSKYCPNYKKIRKEMKE